MYAVIRTGGKQYRIQEGDLVRVEKLDAEVGQSIALDDVLLVGGDAGVRVGRPRVDGACVTAEVVGHGRGRKVITLHYRRRKRYRLRKGHRQSFTRLRIKSIQA